MDVSNDSKLSSTLLFLCQARVLDLFVNLNGCRRLACGLLVFSLEMWFGLHMQPGKGLPTSTVSGVLLNY